MTALGKLVRSTAFRLTLVYLVVFALYAAALLAYFALNTGRLITEQITETVDDEIAGLTEQYTIGGLRQLILIVENRSLRPGSSLYLVTAPTGQALAGNVGSLAPGVLDKTGWSETVYRRLDEQEAAEHSALVRVDAAVRRLPPAGRTRSGGARAHGRDHHGRGARLGRAGRRARARRRVLRHAARAQAASTR